MLKDIQQKISLENINGTDYQDMDDYVEALASILDRKEDMIGLIQDKVMEFNQQQQQLLLLSQSKEEPDLDNCHDKVGGSGSAPGSLSLLMVSTSASADTPANDNHVVDTGPMLGGDGGHASPSSKTASIKV